MFGVVLTKLIFIMDNVFKYFNGFFKGLTGLIMTVLGLGVASPLEGLIHKYELGWNLS